MPSIPTRIHAFLDLAVALLLASAPWWARFAGANAETATAILFALIVVAYNLATDHEVGRVKRVQMTVHLWLDAATGILVAASPWVLSFDQRVWMPHVAAGVLLLVLAFVSQTIPGYERRGAQRAGAG